MVDVFNMIDPLKAAVASVPDLKDRVEDAIDLSELVRRGAMPNKPLMAWVIPAGLRPRSQGDAATSAFTQSVDEHFYVVLALRSANDVSGAKGAPRLNEVIWKVVMAVIGADADEAVGVFRLVGGSVAGLNAGLITYQLEFAVQLQLRSTP